MHWTKMIKFSEGLMVRLEEEASERGRTVEQVVLLIVIEWFREKDDIKGKGKI